MTNLNGKLNSMVIPMGVDTKNFRPLPINDCRKKLNLKNVVYILFAANPSNLVKNYSLALDSYLILKSITKIPIEIIPLKGYKHSEVPILLNAVNVLLMTF